MAQSIVAESVHLDTLEPILDGNGDLQDIMINYRVRYVDPNNSNAEVCFVTYQQPSFALLTEQQITAVTVLRASMKASIQAMYLD